MIQLVNLDYLNEIEQDYPMHPTICFYCGTPIPFKKFLKQLNYEKSGKVLLTNKTLFARDRHTCAFCGNHFFEKNLSRDHIHPVSRGGRDVWTNVVTACIPCNLRKGDKYLSQAGMELLYVPYEPNHYENLILLNRNILQDQMDYLLNGVPKHSRVWQ